MWNSIYYFEVLGCLLRNDFRKTNYIFCDIIGYNRLIQIILALEWNLLKINWNFERLFFLKLKLPFLSIIDRILNVLKIDNVYVLIVIMISLFSNPIRIFSFENFSMIEVYFRIEIFDLLWNSMTFAYYYYCYFYHYFFTRSSLSK